MLQKITPVIGVWLNDFSQPEHTCITYAQIKKWSYLYPQRPLHNPFHSLPSPGDLTSFAIDSFCPFLNIII